MNAASVASPLKLTSNLHRRSPRPGDCLHRSTEECRGPQS
jgi:hypothetical protein